jgi:hypothetical protein
VTICWHPLHWFTIHLAGFSLLRTCLSAVLGYETKTFLAGFEMFWVVIRKRNASNAGHHQHDNKMLYSPLLFLKNQITAMSLGSIAIQAVADEESTTRPRQTSLNVRTRYWLLVNHIEMFNLSKVTVLRRRGRDTVLVIFKLA